MAITAWLDPGAYPHLYAYVTEVAGHRCGVRADCDWGGPCDWQAMCRCGWAGSLFRQMDAGSCRDALRELLVHVGFDPQAHAEATQAAVSAAMRSVREIACAPPTRDGLAQVAALVSSAQAALAEHDRLADAWGSRPC